MSPHQERRLGIEAPHSHLFQLLSMIIFTSIWILDSLVFSFSIQLNNFIHLVVRIVIFIILIAIAYILIRSSNNILFRTPENKDELITEGIFKHVRHPMYLGVLLIYLSCNFLSISLISFAIWIIVFIIYDRLATYEEKQLETLFKEKFLEYKKKVPKWIPHK